MNETQNTQMWRSKHLQCFAADKIKIYPNPARTELQINVLFDVKIERLELFDIGGKRARAFGIKENVLDVSGLISGVYFLKISTEEGVITEKVLIE